jgi:hypothetical protein
VRNLEIFGGMRLSLGPENVDVEGAGAPFLMPDAPPLPLDRLRHPEKRKEREGGFETHGRVQVAWLRGPEGLGLVDARDGDDAGAINATKALERSFEVREAIAEVGAETDNDRARG